MGIDATMVVHNEGERLSEKELKRMSAELVESTGEDHFLIFREPFVSEHHDGEKRPLEELPSDSWVLDALPVDPNVAGGQWIRVNYHGRYYGIDYERGNFMAIKTIAEWLEIKIVNSTIYYGGHSPLEVFGPAKRAGLMKHFVEHGHRPYIRNTAPDFDRPYCCFCEMEMTGIKHNQEWEGFSCSGCKVYVEVNGEKAKIWKEYPDWGESEEPDAEIERGEGEMKYQIVYKDYFAPESNVDTLVDSI